MRLLPIYKKGDKLECENYRAITILNAAYKVLSQILFCRISGRAKDFVGTYQAGFVEGISTTDQIFMQCQIIQKCREYQAFKAWYDSIEHVELWIIIKENGYPGKLIRDHP